MRHRLLLSVVLILLAPGWALAWRAINRLEVFPVSDTVFEVIGRPGSGAVEYWCAAGDFARQVIGTAATQRIYIWRAYGPSVIRPGRRAVHFSLSPPPDASPSPGYSLSVKAVGDNLSSSFARQYCFSDDLFDPFRRFGW